MLRGITLISKFILLLFIARYLTPADLGVWGLMNMTLGIGVLFLGMDFHAFNTREILAVEQLSFVPYLRDQLVFHGLMSLVVFPLATLAFIINVIPWHYALWFYGLLVLEHLSQESMRVLITLSRPTLANVVVFFRNGAWVYVVVTILYFTPDQRSLHVIWGGWMVGVLISILVSGFALKNLPWGILRENPVNWFWIRGGFKVALPFFSSSLAFLGIQNMDRYFLKLYFDESYVGIYTFYLSISNVIYVAIYTGIIMILYPKLVASYQHCDYTEYNVLMKKMTWGIIGALLVLIGLAYVLIDPILQLVDKQPYTANKGIFAYTLAFTAILTLSNIPHYALYVRHRDKGIIFSTYVAFLVALIANMLLVPEYGLQGAGAATLIGMCVIFILKGLILVNWKF